LCALAQASFDREYDGTWNVVVGTDFGASITHELARIIFFAVAAEECNIYVLLFQQTDTPPIEGSSDFDDLQFHHATTSPVKASSTSQGGRERQGWGLADV